MVRLFACSFSDHAVFQFPSQGPLGAWTGYSGDGEHPALCKVVIPCCGYTNVLIG